jgi:hypothetical protein
VSSLCSINTVKIALHVVWISEITNVDGTSLARLQMAKDAVKYFPQESAQMAM